MHGLRLAPLPLSLQEETSLFSVDNCVVNARGHYVQWVQRGRREETEGEPQGDVSCSISTGLFLFALSSPSLSVLLLLFLWPESHRGVIRVCRSLRALSSPSPPLQASQTEERGSSLGLCTGWGFAQNHYDPASCFVHGRGRGGLGSSLKMQPG